MIDKRQNLIQSVKLAVSNYMRANISNSDIQNWLTEGCSFQIQVTVDDIVSWKRHNLVLHCVIGPKSTTADMKLKIYHEMPAQYAMRDLKRDTVEDQASFEDAVPDV